MSRYWGVSARLAVFALASAVAGSTLADMDACRKIEDAQARLACFDELAVERSSAAADTPEASDPAQAAEQTEREQRATAPAQKRDRSRRNIPENETIRDLAIREMGTDAYGRLVITLEDGAIWRQVDDRRTTLSRSDRVNIRQTAFGGWHMRDVGSRKRSIQVTQIEP